MNSEHIKLKSDKKCKNVDNKLTIKLIMLIFAR